MASTYLTKTFSNSGTRTTWTYSCWLKRASLGSYQRFGSCDNDSDGSDDDLFQIKDTDELQILLYKSAATYATLVTNRKLRDTSAWYHIVIVWDSTNATSADRFRLYINGERETSFSSEIQPSQNEVSLVNSNLYPFEIGRRGLNNTQYFDGLMSHIHFIDGTAYDATAFGEYDANGVWKIKTDVSVTYGTNGFFILKDGNSVTDQSGNGNNWTVGGGTLTNTEDSPSNVFATWNPLVNQGVETYSNGNTTIDKPIGGDSFMYSTLGFSSGKYYFEYKLNSFSDNSHMVGFWDDTRLSTGTGFGNGVYLIYAKSGNANSITAYGTTVQSNLTSFSAGDIIGVAIDYDNGTVQFYRNGSTYGSQVTGLSSNLNGKTIYFGAFGEGHGSLSRIFNASANFGNGYFGTTAVASAGTNASGNGIFEYDVPTGYTALSTKGLNL